MERCDISGFLAAWKQYEDREVKSVCKHCCFEDRNGHSPECVWRKAFESGPNGWKDKF